MHKSDEEKTTAEKSGAVWEYPYGHIEQSVNRLRRKNQKHAAPTIHYLTKNAGETTPFAEPPAKGSTKGNEGQTR